MRSNFIPEYIVETFMLVDEATAVIFRSIARPYKYTISVNTDVK